MHPYLYSGHSTISRRHQASSHRCHGVDSVATPNDTTSHHITCNITNKWIKISKCVCVCVGRLFSSVCSTRKTKTKREKGASKTRDRKIESIYLMHNLDICSPFQMTEYCICKVVAMADALIKIAIYSTLQYDCRCAVAIHSLCVRCAMCIVWRCSCASIFSSATYSIVHIPVVLWTWIWIYVQYFRTHTFVSLHLKRSDSMVWYFFSVSIVYVWTQGMHFWWMIKQVGIHRRGKGRTNNYYYLSQISIFNVRCLAVEVISDGNLLPGYAIPLSISIWNSTNEEECIHIKSGQTISSD